MCFCTANMYKSNMSLCVCMTNTYTQCVCAANMHLCVFFIANTNKANMSVNLYGKYTYLHTCVCIANTSVGNATFCADSRVRIRRAWHCHSKLHCQGIKTVLQYSRNVMFFSAIYLKLIHIVPMCYILRRKLYEADSYKFNYIEPKTQK